MATEYDHLLQSAYLYGWADGSFAARFEPCPAVHPAGPVCRGRTPVDFARSLWSHRPGQPPAGLELSAPLWYARGFAAALALAGTSVGRPGPTAEVAGGLLATADGEHHGAVEGTVDACTRTRSPG